MSEYYRLDGRDVVPCDAKRWSETFENPNSRRVAESVIGESRVSTVFLGLDHSFGLGGPPLLFETLVFGGKLDDEMDRCSTFEEAEAMHVAMCQRVIEAGE